MAVVILVVILVLFGILDPCNCATFEKVRVQVTSRYTIRTFVDGQPPSRTILIESDNSLGRYVNNQPLEGVIIEHQRIPELTRNSIADLPTIEDIRIAFCGLREIKPGAFRDIPNLDRLELDHNEIQEIEEGVFDFPVTWLSLKFNRISKINDGAFQNKNLSHLELDNNFISRWDSTTLKGTTSLISISIGHNLLREIPKDFLGEARPLHFWYIMLNDNRISRIESGAFANMSTLGILDLQNNWLEELQPGVLKGLKEVTSLELNNNRISTIDEDVFTDMEISTIELKANRLSCVPLGLTKIRGLHEIEVDGNPMSCACVDRWEDWRREHRGSLVVAIEGIRKNCVKESQ